VNEPTYARSSVLVLIAALLAFAAPAAAQRRQQPRSTATPAVSAGTPVERPIVFSVSGWVVDAGNHNRVESAIIELQPVTGGLVGTTVTMGNGEFEFHNIPAGTYNLVVEPLGYEKVTREVEIPYGETMGIEVEVRRPVEAATPFRGGSKVSVRELSIPQKAQDAMQKGMSLLYKKSDYAGSIKAFRRAIQAYPDYYEAYAYMGVAYEKLGDAASSEQALRKSVELSQEHYLNALCLLAALLSDHRRFADAEPIARRAVDLDPNSWLANSALGNAFLGLNKNKEAEASLAAAVKLQPQNPTLHLLLANAHIRLRDYPALLEDLNAYLQLDPAGPFAGQVRTERDAVRSSLARALAGSATVSAPER
jgi:Tfp pilus assembly protein PilF